MIEALYKLFIALMIALFVGFGISVFYPGPTAPDYPTGLVNKSSDELTVAEQEAQTDYDNQSKIYQDDFAVYSRTVSVVAIIFSVLLLIVSLTLLSGVAVINDGVLFGGIFTLLYGIIRSFMSESSKVQFSAVTVGLVIALVLGYLRFVRPAPKTHK